MNQAARAQCSEQGKRGARIIRRFIVPAVVPKAPLSRRKLWWGAGHDAGAFPLESGLGIHSETRATSAEGGPGPGHDSEQGNRVLQCSALTSNITDLTVEGQRLLKLGMSRGNGPAAVRP